MKKTLALLIALVSAFSFTACKKEPIIGYEPEIPKEWAEEAEKEKNNPYTEIIKTTAFDGVWREASTGKLYYFYNGHIFEMENVEDTSEIPLWGMVVIAQTVEKVKKDEYESKLGYEAGEEFAAYINSTNSEINEAKLIAVEEGKVKAVLPDEKEIVFKYVKAVETWPEGFNM
ncbi:MAG: hypothetical protein IKW02_03860 [Clostridia bacterium]|nr:hypothetical protein [Clostridia bacterium]